MQQFFRSHEVDRKSKSRSMAAFPRRSKRNKQAATLLTPGLTGHSDEFFKLSDSLFNVILRVLCIGARIAIYNSIWQDFIISSGGGAVTLKGAANMSPLFKVWGS